MAKVNITSPVGRLVVGSLYKPQTTDMLGKPLTVKSGPNAGQPKVQFFFAVAFKKGAEQHWNQTDWGAKIYALAQSEFPAGNANSATFAWKVADGDSSELNQNNKRLSDREGYPGHWVINFTSGFAPKIYNANGTLVLDTPDAVKLGYFVQVNFDVTGNGGPPNAGLFINPSMIAFSAPGPEIYIGPDAASAGFGASPLPAGALEQPVQAAFNPPATVAAVVAIQPNPAFLMMPPPVVAAHVLTEKAQGNTYEGLIAQGWTDALLVQHGVMLA